MQLIGKHRNAFAVDSNELGSHDFHLHRIETGDAKDFLYKVRWSNTAQTEWVNGNNITAKIGISLQKDCRW
jgi:hypothetical protein